MLILRKMNASKEKSIIGRREIADLPDFGLSEVDVKTDTGAYTSSIHVSKCDLDQQNGKDFLKVIFLDDKFDSYTGEEIHFDKFRRKKVKSSTGQEQIRFFVFGRIRIAGRIIKTEFSLTQRSGMRFPILLGRKLLNNHFMVDTSLKYVHKK